MESHLRSRAIAACAEFPNDNPALHRGAIWCCVEIGGQAVCERAVAPSPKEDDVAPVEPTPTEPAALAHATADDLAQDVAMLVEEVAALVEPLKSVEPFVLAEPDEAAAEAHDEIAEADEAIVIVDELAFDSVVVEEAPPARDEAPGADPFAVLLRVLEDVARIGGCPEETLVGLRVVLGATRVDETIMPRACVDSLLAGGMLRQGEHGLVRAEPFSRQVVAWQGILRGESEDFGGCGGAMLDEWCADLLAKIVGSPSRVEGLRRELRGRGVAAFGLVADAA
jgi:hypothetical protein